MGRNSRSPQRAVVRRNRRALVRRRLRGDSYRCTALSIDGKHVTWECREGHRFTKVPKAYKDRDPTPRELAWLEQLVRERWSAAAHGGRQTCPQCLAQAYKDLDAELGW